MTCSRQHTRGPAWTGEAIPRADFDTWWTVCFAEILDGIDVT